MGSDDLFRKRKARTYAALERQKIKRAQIKRFLIVCEGTKTEPNYLKELVADFGIRPSSIKIAPNNGSSPDRVVAHGIGLYDADAQSGDSFDQVFFVFDRDKHLSYAASVQRVTDCVDAGKPFLAVTSVPCFEYWLLLHFGFTDQPFAAAGKKSACDNLIAVLRTKEGFNNYGKGKQGIYALLKGKMPMAIKSAAKGLKNAKRTGEENPSTRIHELVEVLRSLGQ